jgi:hypothetical protein
LRTLKLDTRPFLLKTNRWTDSFPVLISLFQTKKLNKLSAYIFINFPMTEPAITLELVAKHNLTPDGHAVP